MSRERRRGGDGGRRPGQPGPASDRPDGAGESEFRRALGDVRPIAAGKPLAPPPEPGAGRPARPRPRDDGDVPAGFAIERDGERIRGRAPGVSRALVARLAQGDPAPDRSIDLHGHGVASAERALRQALASAVQEGQRCLRVVHGRGRNSPDGPVLKEAFPGWLERAPEFRHVLAFTTALPRDGGPGASYVLLRRAR